MQLPKYSNMLLTGNNNSSISPLTETAQMLLSLKIAKRSKPPAYVTCVYMCIYMCIIMYYNNIKERKVASIYLLYISMCI